MRSLKVQLRWLSLCPLSLYLACTTMTLPPLGRIGGPEAADFPDARAVVLEDVATLSYELATPKGRDHRQVVAVLDHRRRIKVLRPEGLSEARVRLPLDAYSTVTEVRARSAAENGVPREMGQRATRIVSRAPVGERAKDVVDLAFDIPGASVDGIVEYRYKRVYLDPLAVPLWTYGAGHLPVLHAEFGIKSARDISIDVRHGNGDRSLDREPQRREVDGHGHARLVFFINDQPPIFFEPHGVHLAHHAPWTATTLRQVRDGGKLLRYESWSQVTSVVGRRLDAVDAVGKKGSIRERLIQARDELQPMLGFGVGVRTPQSASELKKGAPACSRDAAAYGRDSLLGTEKAHPAIVLLTGPAAPPFSEDFPSLAPFERVVLEIDAQMDLPEASLCSGAPWRQDFGCRNTQRRVLIDLACSTCGLGILPTGYEGSRALRIEPNGQTSWFTVTQGGPERHSLWLESHYTMDVDGVLKGHLQGEARGTVAAVWRENMSHPERQDQERVADRAANLSLILGEGDAPRLDGLVTRYADSPEKPVAFEAKLNNRLDGGSVGRPALSAEKLAGSTTAQFWSGQRRTAAQIGGPRWREESVEVSLPLGWRAQLPPPVRIIGDHLEYGAEFYQTGRKLRYIRRLVLKTPVIDADSWEAFHEHYERIQAAESAPFLFQIGD